MSKLQFLDGYLGCGCDSGSGSSQPSSSTATVEEKANQEKDNAIQYVSTKLMNDNGFTATSDILKKAGIPFTRNEKDQSITVSTPNGVQTVPNFVDTAAASSLVDQLTAPVKEELKKLAPADQTKARLAVKVGLGLLGVGILYRVFRGSSRPSLSGVPSSKKRVAVVRI